MATPTMATAPAATAKTGKPKGKAKASAWAKFARFVASDHRYVLLGTAVVAVGALELSTVEPSSMSLLGSVPALGAVFQAACAAWVVLAVAALIYKLAHWKTYGEVAPFVRPAAKRGLRIASYAVWAIALLLLVDRVVLGLVACALSVTTMTKNPSDPVASAFYMAYNSSGIYLHGIEVTIELALFGTLIAFVLALLLVFLRIQTPDRSDNDFVRFLKTVGNGFARLYSTVIRGTPMMVQGLIIYYAGFGLVRGFGLSISETQAIWSFFVAGLTTVSCCSAAYMAEVLRASIEAIDAGQTEAARSLGLSQWQAMRKVVFPQGVKNAIPAISNEFIINIKDSSVLSVIGVFDLMYATTSVAGIYFKQMELYVLTAVTYLVLTLVANKLLSFLSARLGMETRNVMSTQQ